MNTDALYESNITSLPLIHKGKVRDIYDIDDKHMLIVTTDRLSAFDVILPSPIPGKGRILTEIADFWFQRFSDLIPNQLSNLTLTDVLPDEAERTPLEGRAIVVKKLKALPIEAIVRGYLIGSGWKEYQKSGSVCGIKLPADLKLADKLPENIFTPSTKAAMGGHDENIDFDTMIELLGEDIANQVRDVSLKIFEAASEYALEHDIIIADTKFEFGLDGEGKLTLIDEVLTPDSSRFWAIEHYEPGISPPSFDKQFVRDYLETLDWNKTAPGPELPEEVARKSAEKYEEARQRLMG